MTNGAAAWLRSPLGLALALMLICALRHYLYPFFPAELRGIVSKGLGGLAMLALLWVIYILRPSREVAAVALWFGAENALVVGCSAAYAIQPWPAEPGQSICSAWVGLDLDVIGMAVCAGILVWMLSIRSEARQ